jgi:hypothetical protein
MAERRRIIEGTWKCSSCDTADIPGGTKVCPVCGNPREDDEAKFDFGKRDEKTGKSSKESVTDADALALAGAGADWYCASCCGANRGDAEKCKICGDSDPTSRLAKKPEKPKNAAPKGPPAPPPASGAGKAAAGMGLMGCLVGGGFLLIGAVIVAAIVATMWTTSADGKVTAMHWERAIQTETFTLVSGKTGWKGDLKVVPSKLPKSGAGEVIGVDNLRSCNRLEKSPKKCEMVNKDVACGTEEKCEVKDKGNGFAEEVCTDVTKYCKEKVEECKEAVFDEKCTYDTYEWKSAGPVATSKGDDNKPAWPTTAAAGALDRQVKTEKYVLTVTSDGTTNTFEPSKEASFTRFSTGQSVVVTTNALGAVTDVTPK